jgi:hypothetical protein
MPLSPIPSMVLPVTCPTFSDSSARDYMQVITRKRVPSFTMSFQTGIPDSRAPHILPTSHDFQMLWVAAQRDLTQMIRLISCRDRPNENLINGARRQHELLVNADAPVAFHGRCEPNPTAGHWIEPNFFAKT